MVLSVSGEPTKSLKMQEKQEMQEYREVNHMT
jgi:hypothetical protein